MLGVLARAAAQVDAVDLGEGFLHGLAQCALGLESPAAQTLGIARDEQHEIADVVRLIDHQPAPHIGFACAHLRIAGDVVGGLGIGQADAQRGFVGRAVFISLPVMVGDDQFSLRDRALEKRIE